MGHNTVTSHAAWKHHITKKKKKESHTSSMYSTVATVGLFILHLLMSRRPRCLRDRMPDLNIIQALALQSGQLVNVLFPICLAYNITNLQTISNNRPSVMCHTPKMFCSILTNIFSILWIIENNLHIIIQHNLVQKYPLSSIWPWLQFFTSWSHVSLFI